MEKIDLTEEKERKNKTTRISSVQNKIKKEFNFLTKVDVKHLQREFILAQAKEICKYINKLKFMPFHAWTSIIMAQVDSQDIDFCYQFYIVKTEFGEYEPDLERIDSLVLTDADKEEFPDFRL